MAESNFKGYIPPASPGMQSTGIRRRQPTGATTQSQPQVVDEDQAVFRTSSLAVLRAKRDNSRMDDPSYIAGAKRVLDFMHRLWKKGKLCDLILVSSGGVEIQAHKIAVAAYSTMLTAKFQEYRPGEIVSLDMTDFHVDTIMAVLYFIYTTDIEITDLTAPQLFACARVLGVDMVMHMCEEFLGNYNTENAILYYSIAEKQGMVELRNRIYVYICDNFIEVSRTKHFCYIPQEKVVGLLSDDNLVVLTELEVFFAVVRWIEYDQEERLPLAPTVLRCVRFHLISPEDLVTQVEVVDRIFSILECHQILHEALKYHALRLANSPLAAKVGYCTHLGPRRVQGQPRTGASVSDPRARPPSPIVVAPLGTPVSVRRKLFSSTPSGNYTLHNNQSQSHSKFMPTNIVQNFKDIDVTTVTETDYDSTVYDQTEDEVEDSMIVTVGGVDLESLDPDIPGRMVMAYDPATNEWRSLTSMRDYTHHHGVAVVEGNLYVIGGSIYDQDNPVHLGTATNSVHVLNLHSVTWSEAAPMKEKRAYVGVASYGRRIFAIGGEDDNRRKLDSIEYYDTEVGTWCYLARMPTGPRIGCACAVLHGCLYVIGGYDNGRGEASVLADVDCFDVDNQRWVRKEPLRVPRCHASLVVCDERIYLIGGRTKRGKLSTPQSVVSLDSVELLNEVDGSWQEVGRLGTSRHGAGCTVAGSRIYVFGGMQSPTPQSLRTVECFDTEDRRLVQQAIADLPYPATGLACVSSPQKSF